MSEKSTIDRLRALGSAETRAGMARYGIDTGRAFGVPVSKLRPLAREIGRDHGLAEQLWASGFHEARLLATMIGDPREMSEAAMDRWAGDFDRGTFATALASTFSARSPSPTRAPSHGRRATSRSSNAPDSP